MNLILLDHPRSPTDGGEPLSEQPRFTDRSSLKLTPRPGPTLAENRFAEITRPLFGDLAVVARRILGDEETARDAVQEALVTLWLEGEMPSNPRAWLVRTVVHRSLHLARSRSRRRKHEDRARSVRIEPTDQDDPARRMEADERCRVLRQALQSLSPDHRSVLVLADIEQKDYESIAASLEIPIGTVRSRLNRSRKALRELLMGLLPEEHLGR
jgi:RNA polymerase sigma-70 factor, ECF subfamily